MSFVIAAPEALVAVASDLAGIGSALAEANAAALAPTTALLAAGADEVSAAIAALFGAHGQAYQTVSAQASAFHAQFVQALTGGGGAYAAAEAANVSAAQSTDQRLLDLINGPTQALLGRPLIGDGANGGPGQDGGPGGVPEGERGNRGTHKSRGEGGGERGGAGGLGLALIKNSEATGPRGRSHAAFTV
ncbi:PE family protein, partial [Mycobacterium tuberculosis]|uniref:PE family protein n=1 Tax=Mycobacterium tuberculosis TaxID=1773 RepID=UPI001F46DCEB